MHATRFRRRAAGFTLIELIMVVAIILLVSTLAVPSFLRSYRGARLRTSARTIVMSHRFARSTAVLRQLSVALLFDAGRSEVEMVTVGAGAYEEDRDKFMDLRTERTGVAAVDAAPGGATAPAEEGARPGVESEMIRPLADRVKIRSFNSSRQDQERDDVYWVNYHPNGMCDAFTVELEDEDGRACTIQVDPLSGRAKVEYD